MLDSIYAPFPFPFHLTYCIIATVVLFLQMKRKDITYYKPMIIAIDFTLIAQITENQTAILVLGIFEAIMVVVIIAMVIMHSINEKKKRTKTPDVLPQHYAKTYSDFNFEEDEDDNI